MIQKLVVVLVVVTLSIVQHSVVLRVDKGLIICLIFASPIQLHPIALSVVCTLSVVWFSIEYLLYVNFSCFSQCIIVWVFYLCCWQWIDFYWYDCFPIHPNVVLLLKFVTLGGCTNGQFVKYIKFCSPCWHDCCFLNFRC